MKFKASALAVTAIAAIGLASSAFAENNSEPTPYNKLGFTTNQTYTVSVSGSTITTSEGSTLLPTPTAANDKIEIDSDADAPLTFTPANGDAKAATELKFNVEASVVPNSVTLAVPSGDDAPQCGFAIKETIENNVASTNFYVYVPGNDPAWTSISGTVPEAGSMFDLTVKLDYRTGFCQVQYLVDGVILGGDDAWYSIKSGSTKVAGIDFIGNGYLSGLRGDVLSVASEAFLVEIPGVSGNVEIVVPEAVLKEIATKTGGDAKDFLADTTTKGTNDKLINLDRLVLTGATADPDAADLPKAVAKPFDAPAGQLAIKMDHLAETLPQIGGATPKFTLQGSNDKSDWTDIASNVTGAAFVFDASKTYKYYRVKAAVVYGSVQ